MAKTIIINNLCLSSNVCYTIDEYKREIKAKEDK